MCKVYNIRVPIFVYSYSEIYKGKHYFSLALILLPKTHGNLHHVIELFVSHRDFLEVTACAAIALARHFLSCVIQVALITNIVDDTLSLLSIDVVYINGSHQLYDGSLPTSLRRRKTGKRRDGIPLLGTVSSKY